MRMALNPGIWPMRWLIYLGGFFLLSSIAWGATGDLRIARAEVTQGLQDAENKVPLIAGKPTKVRVFPIFTNAAAAARVQVDGNLRLSRAGASVEIASENGPVVVGPDFYRADVNGSLIFGVPRDWTEAGDVDLTITVSLSSADTDVDLNENNNSFPDQPLRISFLDQGGARIGFLKVINCDEIEPRDRVATGEAPSWMRAVFPVDPEKLIYQPIRFAPIHYPADCKASPGVVVDGAFYSLLEQERLCSKEPMDVIHAWLHSGGLVNRFGRCLPDMAVSVASDNGDNREDSRWRQTLAHEVTHCLLQSTEHFEVSLGSANLGELGFDVEGIDPFARQVMAKTPDGKATLVDYMSQDKLEKESWITLTTFPLLQQRLAPNQPIKGVPAKVPSSPACPRGEDTAYLVIRGKIEQEGARFYPFMTKSPVDADPCRNETAENGSYELRLRNQDGGYCQVLRFNATPMADDAEGRPFTFTVPNYPNLDRIELVRLSPGGGEVTLAHAFRGVEWPKAEGKDLNFEATVQKKADSVGSTAVLRWAPGLKKRVVDAHSPLDTAAYHIYFSRNNEKKWTLIAADVPSDSQEIRVDLTGLPECTLCSLKLVASDGLQMIEDQFNDFRLSNQIPMSLIVVPVAQSVTIRKGQELRLVGAGYDAESPEPDHGLPRDSLTWTINSRIAGVNIPERTVKGSPATINDLEAGDYEIELVAEDADKAESPPAKLSVKVLAKAGGP